MNKNITLEKIIKNCEQIFNILKNLTYCFTGHRAQKLPWGFNEEDKRCIRVKNNLRNKIENAIKIGYENFMSGMALGFDMIAAEIVLELKKNISTYKADLYIAL